MLSEHVKQTQWRLAERSLRELPLSEPLENSWDFPRESRKEGTSEEQRHGTAGGAEGAVNTRKKKKTGLGNVNL